MWWRPDAALDAEVRERFSDDVVRAAGGAYDGWLSEPRGRLALVILLDQFPRNLHRDSGDAYAYDDRALTIALEGVDRGTDRTLGPYERLFAYLPLEHAEDLAAQRRCVTLCERLVDDAPDAWADDFAQYLDFAVRHLRVIERFGRFPHRNAALGRTSTPAERAYLATSGSPF